MNKITLSLLLFGSLLANESFAQGRTVARLFWQDDSSATVRWGDLKKSADGWSLKEESIEGFPLLDGAEQVLVQMQSDDGLVVVGIHDHSDGAFGSGWVAIESGAVEESHGDHSHWRFKHSPSVLHTRIDADQGNPAHVYRYGKSIVLANDTRDCFTIATAHSVRSAKTPDSSATFYEGGSGHITLAVLENEVAYATWIAPAGDDCGRVDVVGLGVNDGRRYSIKCPTGMLHGATTNSGKVFFASADGVCWVDGDREVDDDPNSVLVHHLPLGRDDQDKALRTGAFANLGKHVLFTAGKISDAKLCVLDASSDAPTLIELPIPLRDGESLTTPVAVKSRGGRNLALLFRESIESPETDAMLVVDLDQNGDGRFDDPALVKEIAIGRNQINGHAGHHEAVVLPNRRHVVISNPADATISTVSLSDFDVNATLTVNGAPTRLIAIGD
jgi:hypothetical protein